MRGLLSTPLFVVNGFFCGLREEYEGLGASVRVLAIEWDGALTGWADLAASVVGCGSPNLAPASSIRGAVFAQWRQLGLPRAPDEVRNVVHFSSSAWEALADRLAWLPAATLHSDIFGHRLLAARLPAHTLQTWLRNPNLAGQSVLEAMEGKNAKDCLAEAKRLLGRSHHRTV